MGCSATEDSEMQGGAYNGDEEKEFEERLDWGIVREEEEGGQAKSYDARPA